MKIVIIIPGHNECKYIAKVLRKAARYCPTTVYVDDGSCDSSAQIASKIATYVVRHKVNLGKGAAMKTGAHFAFDVLKANAVIFMDADNQHDAAEIPLFMRALTTSDVVFGVRVAGMSMPLIRYLGSKFASIVLNVLFGGYIDDIPSGYKAMRKRAFHRIEWKSAGYEVETEIAARVLQQHVPFETVNIKTIYHDNDKGMTILDAIHISTRLFQWKFGM